MDESRAVRNRRAQAERDRRRGTAAKSIRVCMVIAAVSGMVWGSSAFPVRVNWTGSAPVGLYAIFHQATVATGDLVVVCLGGTLAAEGRARGYLAAGTCQNGVSPILKQVAATVGDEVELRSDAFAVNGRVIDRSQRLLVDSLGRILELVPRGRRVVREGEIWVLGVHRERSWDSRYFGPVPSSSIVSVARPILTLNMGRAQ